MEKKKISFSAQGKRADIGDITIFRILPNRYADSVGPFVFLDHIAPVLHEDDKELMNEGTGAHPHRGIATLTYILHGEGEHFDSRGNHAKVFSGGAKWMKAGNGIIHDETFKVDSQTADRMTHGFQFWINLPSHIKAESPEYLPIPAADVPKHILDGDRGWVKVIVGEYENAKSMIPNYSKQFLFHIHLENGKQFSIATEKDLEYAVFLPEHDVIINEDTFKAGEFIEFGREEGMIEIHNPSNSAIDILLFGGEKYTEPIVAHGPFVMNSQSEIAEAFRDYHAGKYGEINNHTNKK
ncbi:MAG: pirin family protein [Saprospiraceae bacterium]|nr:pirin family protein [Saprospiraceae bacterium]